MAPVYFFMNNIICWNSIWRGLFYSAADSYFIYQSSNINSFVRILFTSVSNAFNVIFTCSDRIISQGTNYKLLPQNVSLHLWISFFPFFFKDTSQKRLYLEITHKSVWILQIIKAIESLLFEHHPNSYVIAIFGLDLLWFDQLIGYCKWTKIK